MRCHCLPAALLLGLLPGVVRAQDQAFANAFALYQAGSVEQAHRLLVAIPEKDRSALDLSLLADIDFENGSLAEAESHLQRALKKEPGLRGARSTLATVLEEEGKLDGAESQWEDLRKSSPRDTRFLLALARIRNLQGNSESALAMALEAKQIARHPTRRSSTLLAYSAYKWTLSKTP